MYYLVILAYGVAGWHIHSVEFSDLRYCQTAKVKIEKVNSQIHAECLEK